MEEIAQKVFDSVKAMVPGVFRTEPATPITHPHVDWKAYQSIRDVAEGLGFRHLGDIDVTSVHVDPALMKRAVLAIFAGPDGTEVLGHYRLALRWTPMGILARIFGGRGDFFDLGTMFEGEQGISIDTTSAHASAVWDMPDFIQREALKHGTPLTTVLQRHRQRVQEYRAQQPGARPVVVRSLQDVIAISDATERRKLAYRRQRGWATRDEIARVGKLSGPQLDQLYDAFRKVADRDGEQTRTW